jgi:phage FluMu protein Com
MNIEKVGGGLKCDNPKCDWINETIPDEEFENWLNKPCPKCGENVLTDEDFKFAKALDSSIDFINQLSPEALAMFNQTVLSLISANEIDVPDDIKNVLSSEKLITLVVDTHKGISFKVKESDTEE